MWNARARLRREGGREGGKWRKRETASSFSGGLLPPSPVLPLPPSRGLEGYVMSRSAAAAGRPPGPTGPTPHLAATRAPRTRIARPPDGYFHIPSVQSACVRVYTVYPLPTLSTLPRECVPNPGGNPPRPVKVDAAVKFGRAVSPISFTALETGRRTWLRCSIAD